MYYEELGCGFQIPADLIHNFLTIRQRLTQDNLSSTEATERIDVFTMKNTVP